MGIVYPHDESPKLRRAVPVPRTIPIPRPLFRLARHSRTVGCHPTISSSRPPPARPIVSLQASRRIRATPSSRRPRPIPCRIILRRSSCGASPFAMEFHRRWEIHHVPIDDRTRAIVVVNPNNPTGSFVTRTSRIVLRGSRHADHLRRGLPRLSAGREREQSFMRDDVAHVHARRYLQVGGTAAPQARPGSA